MRNFWVIIILLIIAGSIGAGYRYWKKKKKTKKKEIQPKPKKKVVPDERIKRLQHYINQNLPADYPKIAEDGIWGPKTQAALNYLQEHQKTPQVDRIMQVAKSVYHTVKDATPFDEIIDAGKWAYKKVKSWFS